MGLSLNRLRWLRREIVRVRRFYYTRVWGRSRDYILEGMAGDLTRPAQTYQNLFKICMETLSLPNVKDAYILKAGLIAIDPRRNTVMATASTLAQFCRRFPHASARIFTPAEQRFRGGMAAAIGLVVALGIVVALRFLG